MEKVVVQDGPRWVVVIECVDENQAMAYAEVGPGIRGRILRDGVLHYSWPPRRVPDLGPSKKS